MKKKMKRYNGEDGSAVYTGDDEIVKYRMGMIDDKGNDLTKSKKETVEDNDPYGATKKETSADLDPYNAASKSSTSETPKKAAIAAVKKTVAPAVKEAAKDSSWEDNSKIAPPAPKRSLPRGQQKASDFIERSKAQIGQEGRDQEARYKATQAKMKESGEGLSPRMKAARASEKRAKAADASNYSMKAGGKVKSASARADGCAIRGKTRA
jgi:hypothetical protein